MRMDYDAIRALAKELGVPAKDLIATTASADPFYVGRAGRTAEANWFAELWARFGWGQGMHLRRAHYRLVILEVPVIKPTGDPYVNDSASWGLMKRASLAARFLNLIPAGSLVDRKNPDPLIFAINTDVAGGMPKIGIDWPWPSLGMDMPQDIDLRAHVYPPKIGLSGTQLADGQPFLVELWIEKSTQNDILIPLANRLCVNLVPNTGDTSEIRAREAVERAVEARRPMRILYISDFDPRGFNMPIGLARKIEFLLHDNDLDLDITLDPIALTPGQVDHYNLPRKDFEKGGAASFEEQHGKGGTELDALEAIYPGELAQVVEREVLRYIDPTLSGRCRSAYWDIERQLTEISRVARAPYADDLDEIDRRSREIKTTLQAAIVNARSEVDSLTSEASHIWRNVVPLLEAETIEIDPEAIPSARPATPPSSPLFDSKRDYLQQLDHYRARQGKGGAV